VNVTRKTLLLAALVALLLGPGPNCKADTNDAAFINALTEMGVGTQYTSASKISVHMRFAPRTTRVSATSTCSTPCKRPAACHACSRRCLWGRQPPPTARNTAGTYPERAHTSSEQAGLTNV
jgi:hypothetical protein